MCNGETEGGMRGSFGSSLIGGVVMLLRQQRQHQPVCLLGKRLSWFDLASISRGD